jgi:hypothetical protein
MAASGHYVFISRPVTNGEPPLFSSLFSVKLRTIFPLEARSCKGLTRRHMIVSPALLPADYSSVAADHHAS